MSVSTTIVTCVEAGGLEAQVLLLAESLRAFGGAWSKTDFVAVKPRRGPGLKPITISEFRRLNVGFIDEPFNSKFDWWNNANKSAVMSALETRVSTPHITWLDGDMIVLQPLGDLIPPPGCQFIARAGEGYLGSDGADANAAYWNKLCELVGIDFSAFPNIVSFPDRRGIRAYWQSGIYAYATSTRLGAAHFEIISGWPARAKVWLQPSLPRGMAVSAQRAPLAPTRHTASGKENKVARGTSQSP